MEVIKILERAKALGIFLELKDDNLVLKSTKKDIEPDFIKILKKEKSNIINHLKIYQKRDRSTIVSSDEKIKNYKRDSYKHIPLSFSQERLWFMDQLQGSLEYHLPFALRLSGDLDKNALFSSLQQVVSRHEVLRTVIYSEEGIGYQKLLSADNWELSSKDLSNNSSLVTEELKAFLSAPFDLGTDYMFRSCLYDLGNKEYVLGGTFHHISSDGWSQDILMSEFINLYSSYSSKKEISLSQLPLQYIDYALWQRTYLEGTVLENQLSYWENKLADVNVLQLPTDYVRSSVQSVSGANVSLNLSNILSLGIKSLSKREGVTVFMTLLTAFKVLLSRYSGQEDICVGTPVANRTQKELEGMIGFFVNTLALRSQVTSSSSFMELLQDVKQTTLNAYDHQQVPFEKIVERVVKTRDMSVSPLFQVLFALQNKQNSKNIELDGLTLSNYEDEGEVTSQFDLTMTLNETETEFSVTINYCTDVFKEDTIQRMLVHYQELLEGIVKSPSEQLDNLSILPKEEESLLLNLFNDTAVNYPKDKTLVDLFEEQVNKIPNDIAIVYEGEELSYAALNERSNQLAQYLINKGIKPDTLIGICVDRSLEMLVGILGILKSGGAYVPIDPTYPKDRIEYMLSDSGVKVLLSTNNCIATFSDKSNLDIVLLDTDWNSIAKESSEKLNRISSPENLAYVIYTSGSTGKPKGVMNSHKGILNQLLWAQDAYQLKSSVDVVLQKTTFCFDVSVWELLWPLTSGCKLVFARTGGQGDVLYLKKLIEEQQITTIHFVPSMLGVFLEGVSVGDCTSLQRVLCSGEALTIEQVQLFRSKFPALSFDNLYGPTEAAIHVSSWSIPKDISSLVKIPIGNPVSNTSLYVLSTSKRLVPIGVVGELYIGGVQVSEGYLNREKLTKENFITNPFKEGERIYKTGDLARWLPDGNIEFIGRKDDQVKVRGYRIELGEIEYSLTQLSEVKQASVVTRLDEIGSNHLVGYVVLEGELNKEALQEQLKQSLPEYMVPQLWVALDEMPLTANGKLNRKALPVLNSSELSTKEYVAPRTKTEEELVTIWQDILGVEKIGIHDNFFELGGYSLLVVRLISKIQDIGYTVSIHDVFSYPSIASLSTKLLLDFSSYKVPDNGIIKGCDFITPTMVPLVDLNQEELETIMDQVPGGGANIQDIYPLSPLQEGIYFHHLMSNEAQGDPYVLPHLLSFSSEDKRQEFIITLSFIISRHDVLRTCVLNTGLTEALQVVLREVDLPVEELIIDNNQEILPQVQKEIAPDNLWIDPSQAPMLKLKVADDIANEAYYLVFNFHHLMMDHIGLEKVKQEVALYLSGQETMLPTPALYRDFIGNTLNKEQLEKSKNYFTSLFESIEEPTYPFNLSDTLGDGSTRITSSKAMLSPVLRDTIREVSKKLQVSPATLFHAAYGLVVGRCSDTDYALFGSLFLGRLQGSKGSESSLGLFINTLPVLLDLKSDISTYIKHTNERLQGLLPYEQTPMPNVHNWSGIPNDAPMFSALLNYRHSTGGSSSDSTLDLGVKLLSEDERTNYPFNLDVDDYGDDFRITAKVSATAIDPASVISYMEEALTGLLEDIEKEGSSKQLDSLSILSKREEDQLLNVFNNTAVNYPKDKTTIDLFEKQVAKTPNAIAAVYQGEELSYKQLNERSNQLARYLINKEVKVNTLVGICVDRSLEMLVGILGVLKSGGAYVPIDPAYPQDRIDYMLEDSEVKVLLTENKIKNTFSVKEDLTIILLDNEWESITKESDENLKRVSLPEDLAYVIYTSGSTGKPKGVPIVHASLSNFLLGMIDRLEMEELKVFLSLTTFTFDIFYLELFTPLLLGAKVIVLDNDSIRDGDKLQLAIATYRPDFIQATPSIWQMLVDNQWDNKEGVTVLTGGEAITESLKDSLTNISTTVWNLYGPTEATIWVTAQQLKQEEKVTIGSAISNVELYVIGNSDDVVPVGVVGELCIGGVQLSTGYLKREELTNEKFIANPFKKGARIYRTGDLAKWLPDGSIDLIGRKDNQVKIRGYRIELGEIENALSLIEGVRQSCVLAKEDDKGNKRLVGYVVLEEALNKETLQEELKQGLPEYMVPQLWVELNEMPLTANGKLNRKGLPDLDSSELSSKEYVAPRTETEEQLAVIWQELLGVEKIGIYDNFFELGGHSLLATRLVSTIRKELDIEIAIREIFKFSTVEELASYLDYKVFHFNDSMDESSMVNIEF